MNTNGCITIMAIIIMKFIDENENKLMQCSCLVEWARLNVVSSCARLYSSGAQRQTQTTVLFKSTSIPMCQRQWQWQSAIESSRN